MAKYVKAMNLKPGNRVRFDSDKVYRIESTESHAHSEFYSLNKIELTISVEGDESVRPFPATYYAGDQIEIVE